MATRSSGSTRPSISRPALIPAATLSVATKLTGTSLFRAESRVTIVMPRRAASSARGTRRLKSDAARRMASGSCSITLPRISIWRSTSFSQRGPTIVGSTSSSVAASWMPARTICQNSMCGPVVLSTTMTSSLPSGSSIRRRRGTPRTARGTATATITMRTM